MKLQLGLVANFFAHVMESACSSVWAPGDELEAQAASCTKHVDEVLRQQTEDPTSEELLLQPECVTQLRALQIHAMDITMLACGRFIDHAKLSEKRISKELLEHLATAGLDVTNEAVYSRCGMSKSHLFTPGQLSHNRRKRRYPSRLLRNKCMTGKEMTIEGSVVPASAVLHSLPDLSPEDVDFTVYMSFDDVLGSGETEWCSL